jgi:hypothetical protein
MIALTFGGGFFNLNWFVLFMLLIHVSVMDVTCPI